MKARAAYQLVPFAFGVGCLLVCLAAVEVLIDRGAINAFIVPKPSDIVLSFSRVFSDEHVIQRFALTFGEAMAATVMLSVAGIALGYADGDEVGGAR